MQKHLLVIESNTTGTGMLALQKARELGLSPLFFTNKPERYKGLEQTGCPIVVCDTNSLDTLTSAIAAHIEVKHVSGITTTSEFYLEIVAQLTTNYNLPGNPPQAMSACRNKALTRLCLEAAGIRQPRFATICSSEEVENALSSLDPPYIVKPADDTGSNDVLFCQNTEEARQHALHLLTIHTNVRGQQTARTVLVEEYLAAPEFSVETFTWKGQTSLIGITEKTLIGFPHFVEYRHIFPAHLSQEVAKGIQETVQQALKALGITHGATHTEIKVLPEGCAIIEVNARLAGGMIPELIHIVTGIDMLEQQIKTAVGGQPDLPVNYSGYAGIQFLVAYHNGIWMGLQGVESALTINGIERISITAPTGSLVSLPRSAYDRLGFVLAQADTYTQVQHCLEAALAELELVVIPEQTAKEIGI
jgi:S-sulfo-L-cysteine synthase (3-phospho-L-serine-dependent)